jgi:hypothetical protein
VQLVIASDTSVLYIGKTDLDIPKFLVIDEEVQQKNDGSTYLQKKHANAAYALYFGRPPSARYILVQCLDRSLDSVWFWGSDYSVPSIGTVGSPDADSGALYSRTASDSLTRSPARVKFGPSYCTAGK